MIENKEKNFNPLNYEYSYETKEVSDLLNSQGFVLIENTGGKLNSVSILQSLGIIIPQHTGNLEHEVRSVEATKHLSYSQSANTIQAHTEAPGWNPEPEFIALYCHRQAKCGAGHTAILDVMTLLEYLDDEETLLLKNELVEFPSPNIGIEKGFQIVSPVIRNENNRTKIRFSYNFFTSGTYYPDPSANIAYEKLPLGYKGKQLAEKINQLFDLYAMRILIPEDALFVWDNSRLLHARSAYSDLSRHLTRYWLKNKIAL